MILARLAVLSFFCPPCCILAQERAIFIDIPHGASGAVYSEFGLIGSLPYMGKVDVERTRRLFIVADGLQFMEVDGSGFSSSETIIRPSPFAWTVPLDSMETFLLTDIHVTQMTTMVDQSSTQLGNFWDFRSLAQEGRDFLRKELSTSTNGPVRMKLVPTLEKTFHYYKDEGHYLENYSIIHQINWSLLDDRTGKELYSKTNFGGHYIGYYSLTGKNKNTRRAEEQNYASRKAFISALQGVLVDSAFLAVAKKRVTYEPLDTLAPLAITNVSFTYATSVKQCLPSVVTVHSSTGFGSAFFISEEGHLLTNDHVLGPQDTTVLVTLNNGFSIQASVVRRRTEADVALLKIDGARMMPLKCTPNDNTPGTEVFAIGTPERTELAQTLTKGIISGNREMVGRSYIQTDVAINRGNSGGPLIDPEGNVIGIISAKIMGAGTEALGFAIPIGEAFKELRIK